MDLDGRLLCRRMVGQPSRTPGNVIVELAVRGPRRALFFPHRTRTWRFDPLNVQLMVVEDAERDLPRVELVDRERAEAAARTFGQELPDETTLLQILDADATAMCAVDDRVEPVPWEQRRRTDHQRAVQLGSTHTDWHASWTTEREVRMTDLRQERPERPPTGAAQS